MPPPYLLTMLHAAPYYGGKSAGNQMSQAGRWIARHLPYRDIYMEPFAGMCGVLLQRKPSRLEVVNDSDARITNWWRCIRDSPNEFRHLLDHSPRSDFDFAWAKKITESATLPNLSDPSNEHDLQVGIATHILLADSMFHCLGNAGRMAVPYGYGRGRGPTDIEQLAERMRKVHLVNRDAVEVLSKIAPHSNAVIYCDPPYRDDDSGTTPSIGGRSTGTPTSCPPRKRPSPPPALESSMPMIADSRPGLPSIEPCPRPPAQTGATDEPPPLRPLPGPPEQNGPAPLP